MKAIKKVTGVLLIAGAFAGGCLGVDSGTPPAEVRGPLAPSTSDCLAELAAGRNVIPGRFIVSFRADRLSPLAADREAAVAAALGSRKQYFEIGIANAVAVDLEDAEVARLRADSRVAYVEPDGLACALDDAGTEDEVAGNGRPKPSEPPPPCATGAAETMPSGLVEILAAERVHTGAGVTVAVVDTGISSAHSDLAGRVTESVTFIDGTTDGEDDAGHGTHVAGTIAAVQDNGIGVVGVAPGANLMAVKVLDSSGSGSWSSVAAGITWATDNGADVINLSLGGTLGSATLEAAVHYAFDHGVFVAVAAGNEGKAARLSYPAAYDDAVITVTAEDPATNRFPSWSNYGIPPVDIAAPGVSICSTTMDGAYGLKSGTSMATPHVAGAAAVYIEADLAAQIAAGTSPGAVVQPAPFAIRDAFTAGAIPLDDTRRHTENLLSVGGL